MKTNSINNNGCSVCKKGQENYTTFRPAHRPKQTFYQYDYRHTDAELFSTVANSLEECRKRRDTWLLNKWWNSLSFDELEYVTGIEQDRDGNNDVDALFIAEANTFWNKLQPQDKQNIHQYWKHRKGIITLDADDAHSLQMEIICELADLQLEAEYNKSREDMCDENGSFYEEYQDRFNDIYDDIEERLLDNEL